jgi:NADPH:quinone reductase-like Zn-dependent oxidoreductase/acyl carrier protein
VIDQTVVGDLRFFTTAGKPIGELHGVCFKLNAKKEFLQKAVDRKLTNWLYETRWEPLSTLPAATQMQGTLLIVSDGNPVAAELAKVVRDGGARAITAQSGSAYSQQGSDSFISRFSSIADCEQLLKAAMAPGQPLTRVIFFAAGSSAECVDGPAVPRLASWQTEQLLYLTQALAQNAAGELPSLAVVAQGFQLPNIGIRSSLAGTAAWGLGRAVTAELPELHCKLIDIERALPPARAAEMLAAEISCESDENQVALGDGKRLALRLAHAEASIFGRENAVVADPRNPVQMEIAVRGDFKQLRFVPQKLKPPGPGEVQLRMLATALNFRDVLNALGMYPGDPGPLGVECIGEIVALGPGVSGWSVGEQVMAMPFRGYCTYSNAPVNMIFRRPANLSLAEAATVLTGYLTAIYSLSHLGNMKAGDRVLIHAGAGGVGLAAVQLAQQAGAEIFATAGSPAKREYLRQLGVPHVMDSRSLDFAATIRELTAGQGIDLVLNSLTGPAITEGLSLLKPGGSFLEIGKNELLNPAQVLKINPKAKYYVVDLVPPFRDTPQLMNQLVASITTSLEAGKLRPLPYRTFSLSEAPDAFRYMAAARHIGKVVVLHHSASQLDASSTYLITGGLGGLGLAVARWMVDGGARQIILVGRRAPNPAAAKAIADLQAAGAKVAVAQADVGDRQQLADLLAAHTSAEKPLRGVIHAAGLIDDGALLLQDWPRFARVLKPKIDGAWNLHELTLPMPLDFFVLFSSGAGLFGNPGQSSYAAANVFLDELAVARQAAGLPALSINWGPWAEVGMAAAMNQRHEEDWSSRGLSTIDPAGGLKLLEMMIARNQIGQMAVLPVDDSAWRPAAGRAISPLIKNLVGAADTEKDQASSGTAQASERLRQAAPADRRNVMIELVGETVLEIFGLDRRRSIPPDQNLTTLGMDSLLAIQLSNRLKTSFAASVPSTLTFQYPTIEAIADYLLKALSAGDEAAGPSGNGVQREVSNTNVTEDGKRRSPQQAETILANLHQLSDRDVETLLRGMERKRDSA